MLELIKLALAAAEPARLLVEYLNRQGIAAEQRVQADGIQILVPGETLAPAQRLLQQVQENPQLLNQSAWQSSHTTGKRAAFTGLGSGWQRFAPLTLTVAILAVLIYLSPYVVGGRIYQLLFFPPQLSDLASQPWRLFTPALLHFSIMHIAFDVIWWLDLGNTIERRQSAWHLLIIALVVAAVSNTAQFLVSGPNFGGLSGVIYGLLSYMWLWGYLRPASGLALRPSVAVIMLGWLVLCWTGWLGPVANFAHLAGLVSGLVLAVITLTFTRANSSKMGSVP